MRTVLVAISGRQQARNILRTDVLKTLLATKDVRVVVLVPALKLAYYREEFQLPNLIFEGVEFKQEFVSRLDSFFNSLSLYYVDSTTGRFLKKLGYWYERRQPVRYILSRTALALFGHTQALRSLARALDYRLVSDTRLLRYFDRYRPDMVFASNVAASLDRSLLRHAKRSGVKTTGMVNSWDNITYAKYPFRILPELLICHNKIIAGEAVKYLDVRKQNIFISGIPQHDFYVTNPRATREELYKRLSVDLKKRIVLFTSQGSTANQTEWQTLTLLARAFDEGRLPSDLMVIFRQHPTEKTELKNIPVHKQIMVDDSKTTLSTGAGSFSEILEKDMEHLADTIFHAAVIITTTSSISIDAALFDKPTINIAFDGWEKRPFWKSVRRKFSKYHAHYQYIVKSGGVSMAWTFDELVAAINRYLY